MVDDDVTADGGEDTPDDDDVAENVEPEHDTDPRADDDAAEADTDPETGEPDETDAEDAEGGSDAAADVDLLHGVPVTESLGQRVLHPSREQLVEVVTALAQDGFTMCLDVTGVDYLLIAARDLPAGIEPERFEVVVTLINHQLRERLRLRVQVPGDDPTCPSIVGVHAGAEANERETYDMFGIEFGDHPDLTRILMPEDWDGHPLRKDYDTGAIPVQFKGAGREVRT